MDYSELPETVLMIFSFVVDYQEVRALAFTCRMLCNILTKIASFANFWQCHASHVLGKDTRELSKELQSEDGWSEAEFHSHLRWIVKNGNPIPLKDNPLLIKMMIHSTEENEKLVVDYVYDNQKIDLIVLLMKFFCGIMPNEALIVNTLSQMPKDHPATIQYFAAQKQLTLTYRSQLRKMKNSPPENVGN